MCEEENLDVAVRVAVQQQLLADFCGQELEDGQVGGRQLCHQAVMAADRHACAGQQLVQLLDECANLQASALMHLI